MQPAIEEGEAGCHRQQEKERSRAQQKAVAQASRQTGPEGTKARPYLGVGPGGDGADQAVEGPHLPRRHPANVQPRVRNARRPPHALYRPGQEEPRHPTQDPSQGKPEHPGQGCQSALDHHPWLRREDQEVGQDEDEGEAVEGVEGEGKRGDLRSQRHQQGVGEKAHRPPGMVLGDDLGEQSHRPSLESVGVEHQSQCGSETQLEAHVPENQRVDQRHPEGRRGQGCGDVGGPAQVLAQEVEDAHDGGPYHRRACAHQQGVEDNATDGGPNRPPGAQESAKEPVENTTDDGDVEPTDGDDMGGAGSGKGLTDVLGDSALHAQQDAGQQGGGRIVQDPTDNGLGAPTESQERRLDGVDRRPPHPDRLRPSDVGEDALTGQVLTVREVGELWRGLQQTGHLQPVTVTEGRVAGEAHQCQPRTGTS